MINGEKSTKKFVFYDFFCTFAMLINIKIWRGGRVVDCGGLVLIRVLQGNFNLGCKTTLINESLGFRNISFGDGLLS